MRRRLEFIASSMHSRKTDAGIERYRPHISRTLLTCSGRPATSPLPGLGGTELCVALALAGDGLMGNGATGGPAAARRARGAPARGGVLRCPGLCPVVRKRSRLGMLA